MAFVHVSMRTRMHTSAAGVLRCGRCASWRPRARTPIASNIQAERQPPLSPAPQKTISCLPSWICSMPVPMQWALVAHAEPIEYEVPWILKSVESTAETEEDMVRVTR